MSEAACIFCKILAGAAPASIVYRDELVTAFMDIQPVTPGHLLVIPNQHSIDLAGVAPETAAHIMRTGQRLAAALRASGLRCEGINLHLADGQAAGQEVWHCHLHVIPRFTGDGFGLKMPPAYRSSRPAREQLDTLADQIRATLK
jgi:diadenosine tetraphosphate (Ap4A) HIT family hydrolase